MGSAVSVEQRKNVIEELVYGKFFSPKQYDSKDQIMGNFFFSKF